MENHRQSLGKCARPAVLARVNGGLPYLVIQDAYFEHNGEPLIVHRYESIELDLKYMKRKLLHIYQLRGELCICKIVVEDKKNQYSYDGKKVQWKFVNKWCCC